MLLCSLLFALTAQAQWVEFEPCGLAKADKDEFIRFSGKASALDKVYIWAPSIIAVLGFSEDVTSDGVECTGVQIAGRSFYMLGTLEQTIRKLKRAREDFRMDSDCKPGRYCVDRRPFGMD